jgi:quercetin dioxygenase-like cupin family protein
LKTKETSMPAEARTLVHPDIKPAEKPELASHYLDVPNMPWEVTKFPGIQIKVLYSDDSGITTALFKLAPGAVVPLHEHTALEQTYVLEGTLQDHEGVCGPGQFVWRPAGNQHEAVAPNGAVLLGFFLKPNRFAYGEKFFTEAQSFTETQGSRFRSFPGPGPARRASSAAPRRATAPPWRRATDCMPDGGRCGCAATGGGGRDDDGRRS